jgi:hypothetical protein
MKHIAWKRFPGNTARTSVLDFTHHERPSFPLEGIRMLGYLYLMRLQIQRMISIRLIVCICIVSVVLILIVREDDKS